MFNVVNRIIYRPIFLCWLLVSSPDEHGGSSLAELLSDLEDYKNGDDFCCVIPIKEIEKVYST
jgi:hypothetical protein